MDVQEAVALFLLKQVKQLACSNDEDGYNVTLLEMNLEVFQN